MDMSNMYFFVKYESREIVFSEPRSYRKFMALLGESIERFGVDIYHWCLFPNSILITVAAPDIMLVRRWLQWLMATHAKRHHAENATLGALWKGGPTIRPIQGVDYLPDIPTAARRLVLRRRLISDDQVWPWADSRAKISDNSTRNPYRARFIEHSIIEGLPIGDVTWLEQQARLLGWHPPRPRGRPRSPTRTSYAIT